MENQELTNLLTDAAGEIRRLRRTNEILSAKVEVMDLFAQTLNTAPAQRNECYGVDIASQMDKMIQELADVPALARKQAEDAEHTKAAVRPYGMRKTPGKIG